MYTLSDTNPDSHGPDSHWMLREIHEQPATLSATVERYVAGDGFRMERCSGVLGWLQEVRSRVLLAASGSSRHAGMVAELLVEDLSGLAVDVAYASEYCYRSERAFGDAAVLVVSQSGETADTLAALRKAKLAGHPTLAITNVEGSTMDREATACFPTLAGRERAIPATKSFTAQLLNLYLVALMAATSRGVMGRGELAARISEIAQLPQQIEAQLKDWNRTARAAADRYRTTESFLFLGRGIHYPIAREGALKLKESAYVHAEGYPGGELKHGPSALVAEGTPLVMLATVDRSEAGAVQRYEKIVQLMGEMRRQGAGILAVANRGDEVVAALADHTLFVDEVRDPLLAVSEVIPLQMFSYWMAVQRGIDVDHPRNLTKAVLAE